ncbi:2-succinyl-5-enolpyruvyl-6-hydroxy-3-cyclohexene-1-carboxylic-acid synthase [Leucobacter sp. CSA1]|uniref:2-succinyl-5-enolpyruvyl-6-hydroxy-3-cyclohexene-1-carboxylate synthase n=1 Tax=Leucobacter chromiisoli TaxID=2796471 RepID=A0A934UVF1_9MICO|nr:2-succinyl-5-enolpyruvyl-6-hydroxy-3-cyclohexene-1-carboxylic-acid synthase [Leucobacter chromiisoli]MBK0418877.1 2-succinyl-5-enolpyruvyl-6-hydroxy-3-cyclohexene-1-carboxylic-acid synthase [Leucobacter chromiisoli]
MSAAARGERETLDLAAGAAERLDAGNDGPGDAPSSRFAAALLLELVARGVRDVVVCPGSRSQALALAAAEAERAGAIRLHVRVDERSAAFFALGVARETGMPAPVIVTSGTAVANLLPAALEAHEARVPMLLLTADRPAELRGIRSNQTTRQAGLFDDVARLSLDVPPPGDGDAGEAGPEHPSKAGALAADALAAARGVVAGAAPGPVHLNLAFREPLSGSCGPEADLVAAFASLAAERDTSSGDGAGAPAVQAFAGRYLTVLPSAGDEYVHRGDALAVVIAGDGAGPEAEAFAHAAGLPLLAEVVSGSRFGREAIAAYATLIDDPAVGGLVERAIVFGHPTLTRQIPALLRRDDVEVVIIDPHDGEHYDPSRDAEAFRSARVAEDHDPRALRRWLGAWVVADRELRSERSTVHEPDLGAATATGYKERSAYARAEVAVMREPVSRELLAESVWRASWPHDRLVLAASRLVRVLDSVAQPRRVEVRANRGLGGIDGTVATALGIAAASQGHEDPSRAAGTTRVLIGDLALLHDAGSLQLPPGEERPRIQLLVGNDRGGTIFDGLEVAASADRDAFERVMRTPQDVDLEALARAYGWDYLRVSTRAELERLLTAPVTGPSLVEVPLAR